MASQLRGTAHFLEHATDCECCIEVTNWKQRVDIGQCSHCTVTIKGKPISIALTQCERVSILLDHTQMLEANCCRRVEIQWVLAVPQMQVRLDLCDDMTLFVPEEMTDPATEFQLKTSVSRRACVMVLVRGH